MKLAPITLRDAKAFCARNHRHNQEPPAGAKCATSLVDKAGKLLGVALLADHPTARELANADERACEITRTCTTGARNANSMLYGAICRAAEGLGFDRAYTYTLATESGASLRAAGFRVDRAVRGEVTHSRPSRHRFQRDLYGERRPSGPKVRWVRELRGRSPRALEIAEAVA